VAGHALVAAREEMSPNHAPLGPPPDGYEPIAFQSQDGIALKGWFHQGANGALVVLAHGHGQSRVDRLPEANALAAKGFSALVFDLRAHGESAGDDSMMGDKERLDVAAAIDAGLARSKAERLGALGFSIGAIATSEAAVTDERVRAVALIAPDPDVRRGIASDFGRWGSLSRLPAQHVAEHHGVDLSAGHWEQNLPVLAKRGLLFVIGSREFDMPMHGKMLEEAKAAGAETYQVEGAEHGAYARVAPEAFPERIAEFFQRHLAAP
jgi:uncharacterized protein